MFSYHNPVRVIFGPSSIDELHCQISGNVILIFCTQRFLPTLKSFDQFQFLFTPLYTVYIYTKIESNPSLLSLQDCFNSLGLIIPDTLLCIGGGSVLDFGKAYKAFLSSGLSFFEFNELLSNNITPVLSSSLHSIAVPTTAGTGSEVTPFSTIWDTVNKKKLSISSQFLFYTTAIVDSSFTTSLSITQTLYTSLDAFNQALESLWNINSIHLTQIFAAKAISLGLNSIPKISQDYLPSSSVRDDLSLMSLFAGLSISHTRTALCHSISYPLTLHFGVPHGLACAFTMTAVLKSNLNFNSDFLSSEILSLINCASKSHLVEQVANICIDQGVAANVRSFIPSFDALKNISSEMSTPSRIKNNIDPSPDICSILYDSWYSL